MPTKSSILSFPFSRKKTKTTKVAIINAEKDLATRRAFEVRLAQLNHHDDITIEIIPYPLASSDILRKIENSINEANIIIPLVSIDLISQSDGVLLKLIKFAHDQLNTKVIPILIRATPSWKDIPPFSKIVSPHINQIPFVSNGKYDENKMATIVEGISNILLGKSIDENHKTIISDVPKNVNTLSLKRIYSIGLGFVMASLLVSFLMFFISPMYTYFESTIGVIFPLLLTPIIIAYFIQQFDKTSIQTKILGISGVFLLLYTILFQIFCFPSSIHSATLIKGLSLKDYVAKENPHLTSIDLISIYNSPSYIWDYLYPVEFVIFISNIVLKILLGLSFYILVQRIWKSNTRNGILSS